MFSHDIDGRGIAKAKAGDTVTAVDKTVDHYKLNKTKSMLSGTQDADSTLVLPYYLAREVYNVNFRDWDGEGGVQTQKVKYEDTIKTLPAVPSRAHYTFDGWYLDKAFTTQFDETAPVEKTLNVYAKWTPEPFTITFDTDGGSTVDPITQDYGTAVTAPADPTKDGYTFSGWDSDVPATMPAENLTLTAQWEAVKIEIETASAGTGTAAQKLPDTKESFPTQAVIQLPDNLVKEDKIQVLMVSYDGDGRFLAMEKASLTKTELNTYSARAEIQNDGSVAKVTILVLDKDNWVPLARQQELTK